MSILVILLLSLLCATVGANIQPQNGFVHGTDSRSNVGKTDMEYRMDRMERQFGELREQLLELTTALNNLARKVEHESTEAGKDEQDADVGVEHRNTHSFRNNVINRLRGMDRAGTALRVNNDGVWSTWVGRKVYGSKTIQQYNVTETQCHETCDAKDKCLGYTLKNESDQCWHLMHPYSMYSSEAGWTTVINMGRYLQQYEKIDEDTQYKIKEVRRYARRKYQDLTNDLYNKTNTVNDNLLSAMVRMLYDRHDNTNCWFYYTYEVSYSTHDWHNCAASCFLLEKVVAAGFQKSTLSCFCLLNPGGGVYFCEPNNDYVYLILAYKRYGMAP